MRNIRSVWILTALIVFVVVGFSAARWWLSRQKPQEDDLELLAVYESSPYRNVRPGVRYVGDEKCTVCHEEITASYRLHPMGRSLTNVSRDELQPHSGAPPGFDKLGFHFSVEWPGDRMIHKVVRRDSEGKVVAELSMPVAYTIGSGTRGRSYLVEKDGYLFQSPISWFSQAGIWDLSPGFASFFPGQRGMEPRCMFCHVNQVKPVEDSRYHYEQPVFRGLSIGCERCHGPGELHVRKRIDLEEIKGDFDDTIVNPRHLAPTLRDSVCEQCHLQERYVERRGRQAFDYRPGLPLHEFWAMFAVAPELGSNGKAVGHVQQMALSRCFKASNGKMGCISCHNPHVQPAHETRVEYYRSKCLQCHNNKPCNLPREERAKTAPGDNCLACHMERFPTSNIAHTAITDHRIPRKPDRRGDKSRPPDENAEPIVNFFKDRLPADYPDADRDLGVALVFLNTTGDTISKNMADRAIKKLDSAIKRHPNDVPALEARAFALDIRQKREEAMKAYEDVLRLAPRRELTLILAAALAERLHRTEQALNYRKQLVEVNPWGPEIHLDLAKLYCQREEWDAALKEAEEAVRLNPVDFEARKTLIRACLHTGQRERADREKNALLTMRPQDAIALSEWYRQQAR